MLARTALAVAVLATTATAVMADGPRRMTHGGLSDATSTGGVVQRPRGDGYLIITMEN